MPTAIDSGLTKVETGKLGGYLEASAGIAAQWGQMPSLYARGELGWKPTPWLAGFAFGEANKTGWSSGVGVRATW